MNKTKKLVLIAVLSALGGVIGFVESLIPLPIAIPGFKLGISNIVVLVSIIIFGYKEGILVALLKSLTILLLSGNVSSFIYSFSGALASSISMSIAHKYGRNIFSLPTISIIGAVFHNLAQITVSAIILKNLYMYSYLPVLMILGIFTGIFVGVSSSYIIDNLRKKSIFKE